MEGKLGPHHGAWAEAKGNMECMQSRCVKQGMEGWGEKKSGACNEHVSPGKVLFFDRRGVP